MKIYIISFVFCILFLCNCNNKSTELYQPTNKNLATLCASYWEEYLKMYPFTATAVGENKYNNIFPNNQTQEFRTTENKFYEKYLQELAKINKSTLNNFDAETYDILNYELNLQKEKNTLPFWQMPINQFWSFTLEFQQLGSGSGNQPFKTIQDYDNFTERIKKFPVWVDSAIANMRIGIANENVLPKSLVEKMLPQFKNVLTVDPTRNIFYTPINNLPEGFTPDEKSRLQNAYFYNISNSIIPSYAKLNNFIKNEYLPKARSDKGLSELKQGKEMYAYVIKKFTTTTLSPDSIYNLGLSQVAMIKSEMEKIKNSVKYNGSLNEFFNYINTDKSFKIFKTPKEIIDSFWSVKKTIEPNLSKMFSETPKTKFEIRQTETFRQETASAEYNQGSEDGTRPGIFYIPIMNAKEFNAVGMETLFLHEAIPGHHYQISLQQENKNLPQFRKFLDYSAYAEGWALYTETLGKELGLYKDAYQYLGHLSDAMHRAIRLVVDAGMHSKSMTREDAIEYMMQNERITKPEAVAEIERYMAIPGQALSYYIGKMSIIKMRGKYEKAMNSKFNLPAFHQQILNGGNMPLALLEKKLELWARNYP
jgi:uncharacterized protein (DUF885 family)